MIKNAITYTITVFFAFSAISCKNKTNGDQGTETRISTTSTVTSSFKVWGNCEMCKETIENAVHVNGISAANWDINSKQMQVTYDTTKIKLEQIQKNIAETGYDNEKYKSNEDAYNSLPECCQYERK
ncbi:MAG TPA: heavy-metal-associated domain-containing protein [Bacteroidia bacterium]|nr:heavy-metal-associated domain-containing protein [Bacteroidia bacterium]